MRHMPALLIAWLHEADTTLRLTLHRVLPGMLLLLLSSCFGTACRKQRPGLNANVNLPVMKFALQVGIDDYTYVNKLNGCVQDILDMKDVLIKTFGFREENIQTLTNKQATHEAIIQAFRTHLIENAKKYPDAIVIFQYSGHGSQVNDGNGDEPDNLDETLVSVDSRDPENKHFDITDDELNDLFDQLSQFTPNITFILDSCHSGSATRGDSTVRRVDKDVRPQPPQPPLSSSRSTSISDHEQVDFLRNNERYITISGCRSTEVSNERIGGLSRKTNGAMTFHLVRALQRAKPDMTYRELMAEVANSVTLEFPAQHPQIEGNIRRFVFGGAADREDPFIKIREVKGKIITLEAGAAQGIKQGTPVAIYAPDTKHLVGQEKNLATAIVTEVNQFTAAAEMPESLPIPSDAKAVLMSPNFATSKLLVALDGSTLLGGSIIAGLKKELAGSKTVELVGLSASATGTGEESHYDVKLLAGKFGEVFKNNQDMISEGTETTLPSADATIYYLSGPDGLSLFNFFATDNDAQSPRKIADALEQLARQRALLALTNDARTGTRSIRLIPGTRSIRLIPIRVFGRLTDDRFKVEREEPAALEEMDLRFGQREYFKFRIENDSGKDMYVTLFDLGTDGSIQILYPPEGAGDSIGNGSAITLQRVFQTTGPPGTEVFKIIGTTAQTDFHFLTQRAVGRGLRSPLESLIETLTVEKRAGVVKVTGVDDWTTSQINFVIGNKK